MSTPSPAALSWPDLVWSHFSRPRFGEFDERLDAAAAAGCSGIGLYIGEFARLRDDEGLTSSAIGTALATRGLCLGEIEALRGWWALDGDGDGSTAAAYRRDEALAIAMADGVGARYVQVIGPYECGFEQVVDRFGRLCDLMARHDVLVGIEFLPFTNIATPRDALRIVEAAGRTNGGVCADIWHHARGTNDLADILALPGDRVFAAQMNDGTMVPATLDYKTDCLTSRVPPGEGEFDCTGFVRALVSIGVTAPISLEVPSTAMWELPAAEAARRAADGMRRVLADAAR